jgi:diguanylate cyclase (GGDEF)-like protein/PAS domain S-box-containing protein
MEQDIPKSEEFCRLIFENAGDMIYSHDLEGRFIFGNRAAERLTGYTCDELLEMNSSSVFGPEYEQEARQLIANGLRLPGSVVREMEIAAKEGHRRPVEVSMQPLYRDGELLGVQGIVRDIRERKNLERQLEHMASRDYLTGLSNRRCFEEELQLQLAQARRYGTSGALLFLDLDHFKDVNDTFGHSAGDELLVSVAQLLRERLPETFLVARLSGDEFTIILPRATINEARRFAEQVLTWLRNSPFLVAGERLTVSGSIGITLVAPDGISTAEELLSRADVAMYQAKEGGRNCVCVYGADMDWRARIESGLAWRKRISEAIEGNLLMLYAQPILDLRQNRISQYEMLVRIPDEHGRPIDASKFMDSAERFGFVQAIDRWMICETIEVLAKCRQLGQEIALEVNLSGAAVGDSELLLMIRDELTTKSVDPRNLVVEITETVAIADIHRAQRFVSGLKRLGCRFALDDFGVGFSSFYHLKHLDVDYLKIDGSFIRDLPRDPVDQHLVKAIVEVARALGKETIAEFVADEETMQLIRELGVDYAQGYHVGHPGEVREVLAEPTREAGRAA